MKSRLDHLEARLQAFIEGKLTSLIPWRSSNQSFAHQLVEAMHSSLAEIDGVPHAPNVYTILVNPSRISTWQANPASIDEFAQMLEQAGREAGIHFSAPPIIRVAIDAALPAEEARVVTSSTRAEAGDTASYEASIEGTGHVGEDVLQGAFFIVNGLTVYPIRRSVTNIGRRHDNDLVVDDPRVSRTHAQLRVVKGNYILFDLNSSGGTYVNSQRVTRSVLNPGDVVSLAGIPLVFGIDSSYEEDSSPSQSGSISPGYTSQFPVVQDDESGKNLS